MLEIDSTDEEQIESNRMEEEREFEQEMEDSEREMRREELLSSGKSEDEIEEYEMESQHSIDDDNRARQCDPFYDLYLDMMEEDDEYRKE